MNKKKVERLVISARNRLIDVVLSKHKQGELTKINEELNEALDELQKPDWISVEDELPPYKEDVIVCNNIKPKKVWMTYRSKRDYFKKDDNDFVIHGDYEPSITHWCKIDKLEV